VTGRHGRHARGRVAAALPPAAGNRGPAGQQPSACPEMTLTADPAREDTWLALHQARMRVLDTLTPREQFEVLVFVSGSAPEAVYEALLLVKPALFGEPVS